MLSLVADVGGTNTRVALADGTVLRDQSVKRYRNSEHNSLSDVLRNYLNTQGNPNCDAACAALAGPIEDGVGRLTNLDWRIDTASLAEAAQAETVALLNDLQAQGYGVAHVAQDKLRTVLPGDPNSFDSNAPKIVVGVGTGFNIAAVFPAGNTRIVTASETGHMSLPVSSNSDFRLSQFVAQKHGFADIEEVLSGRGIENVYAWLSSEAGQQKHVSAAEIFNGLEAGTDPRAQETAQVFARMLGTVIGDLALCHLPFGGIYLIGGVARAITPYLRDLEFERSFCEKGRFADVMSKFQISLIEDDFAALSGCASYLSEISAP